MSKSKDLAEIAALRADMQLLVDALAVELSWATWVPMHQMDDACQSQCILDGKAANDALSTAKEHHGIEPQRP